MSTTTTQAPDPSVGTSMSVLHHGSLPRHFSAILLAASAAVVATVLLIFSSFGFVLWALLTAVAYIAILMTASLRVEGGRKATDRLVTALVHGCFLLAVLPLVSVLWTVAQYGVVRFGPYFLNVSMNGVLPSMDAGGVYHAIVGTLAITGMATLISVPVGVLAAVYLVEYAKGRLKKVITFFVDVMTGIPSIVAGLFVVALWIMLFGPGHLNGAAGALSLTVLMIPVVVRSSEEMLRLVPLELREASYALGVPKWRTITKVVLPTSAGGLITGIMLAIARVIGETAPLVLTAGSSAVSVNWNLFDGQMMNLPVFIYSQVRMGGAVNYERAWALTLILVVMLLFFLARMIGRLIAPKTADSPITRTSVAKRIDVSGLHAHGIFCGGCDDDHRAPVRDGVHRLVRLRQVHLLRTLNRMDEVTRRRRPGQGPPRRLDIYGPDVDPVRSGSALSSRRPTRFHHVDLRQHHAAKLNNPHEQVRCR